MSTSAVLVPEQPTNSATANSAGIVFNFFPVEVGPSKVPVWVGRWQSPEDAARLCEGLPGLVTWRDPSDASRMYAWHPTQVVKAPPAILSEVTVELAESPQLLEKLIADAVGRRFVELGFTEKRGAYVNYAKDSILASIPALAETSRESIGIYPKIITNVFFTKDARERLVIGLVVDVLYTTRLDIPASEWLAAGLGDAVLGGYVSLLPGSPEAAAFPACEGRVVGRVERIQGEHALLADRREADLLKVHLTSIAPEPTRQNLAAYLMARHEKAYSRGEVELQRKLQDLVQPHSRHRLIDAVVHRRLQAAGDLQLLPGITLRFGAMADASRAAFPIRQLNPPMFRYYGMGNSPERRIDKGLIKEGPYDTDRMRRRPPPRLLVLVPEANKGEVQIAVQKFLNGVQSNKDVFRGLRAMYRLPNLQVVTATASLNPRSPMVGYAECIQAAASEAQARGEHFDLVITIIHNAHRSLPDSENPYFQIKSLVLSLLGVPTQMVTIEKLRQRDYDLQYTLNTMALTCYAKLGGTSHVLRLPEEDDGTPTELVFGIGRSVTRQDGNRFGDTQETIGFTTVFRANGEYLYNDCTPYCAGKEYQRQMEETIRRAVEAVAGFEQLPEGAPIRLIFHVPRRPGSKEVDVVLNAVAKLPRYNVEFALVHVNEDHSFQIFDRSNRPTTSAGKTHAYLPKRGISLRLGPRERLVTFIGPDQYKGRGSPTPLRLTLHAKSTFKDVEHVTQQLYQLSFMSARSLTPGIKPVTITYAEQLAAITGRLRGVQSWTVEMITSKLGKKLWYI